MNWYKLYYMMVDFNVGIMLVYLPVYLRSYLGFTELQIGQIYLWAGLVAIIGSLINGIIAQKIPDELNVVKLGGFMMLIGIIGMFYATTFSTVILMCGLLFFMRTTIYVIGDELIINYIKMNPQVNSEYGKIRSFGSLGWGLNFLINGILITINPKLLFISWMIGIILLIAATFKMPRVQIEQNEEFNIKKIKSLFTKKNYIIFIIINGLFWGTINNMQAYSQFIVQDLGGSLFIYGIMNSIILILDFLVMNNSPKINKKLGDRKYYRMLGILLLIKYIIIAIAFEPIFVYISVLIDPFFFGLCVPFGSKYIKTQVDTDLSTVALSIEKMVAQIFAAIGSVIFGAIYINTGGGAVFVIMALLVVINMVFSKLLDFDS